MKNAFYIILSAERRAPKPKNARLPTSADIVEVLEVKKRGMFSAFLTGCPQAFDRKASTIRPVSIDWNLYDDVTLLFPVWAGHPAPAFNAGLALIPKDKVLHVVLAPPVAKRQIARTAQSHFCVRRVIRLHPMRT